MSNKRKYTILVAMMFMLVAALLNPDYSGYQNHYKYNGFTATGQSKLINARGICGDFACTQEMIFGSSIGALNARVARVSKTNFLRKIMGTILFLGCLISMLKIWNVVAIESSDGNDKIFHYSIIGYIQQMDGKI